ncbi:MAG: hypothetical protein IIX89_05210, partial [Oscillospiraceae bacterium]|nr:hypothetical protein [Oscillospiraceae bacterium]
NFSVSEDGGKSWSPCRIGNLAPEGIAVSHGSFLVHGDSLYFFAPQFRGQLGKEMLRMHVYRLDGNLNSDISGYGEVFATKSIELGLDPYLAVSIMLHEERNLQNLRLF